MRLAVRRAIWNCPATRVTLHTRNYKTHNTDIQVRNINENSIVIIATGTPKSVHLAEFHVVTF
jgi:hypothetical protein